MVNSIDKTKDWRYNANTKQNDWRNRNMKKKIVAYTTLSLIIFEIIYTLTLGYSEPITEVIENSSETEAIIIPEITEEYIAEVMASEEPYVAEEIEPEVPPIRYELTPEERIEVERVLMAEAGGECREGIIAVAQCILNAAEREGVRPTEAVKMYKYTPIRKEPNEAVKEAVTAVFDNGETVTDEPILYFYANYITSSWHESQKFVLQIGVHRFFAAKGE